MKRLRRKLKMPSYTQQEPPRQFVGGTEALPEPRSALSEAPSAKKEDPRSQKREIFYNLVNSGLAAFLVLLGSLSSGGLSWKGILAAVIAGGIVGATQFKNYWSTQKPEYSIGLFHFI